MGFTQWPNNSSSGVPTYANFASLPASANDGDLGVTLDTDSLYCYNITLNKWLLIGTGGQTVTQMGALDGGTQSPTGAYVGSNSLFMQSATPVFPGVISSAAQVFQGTKLFLDSVGIGTGTVSAKLDVHHTSNTVAQFTNIGSQGATNGASAGVYADPGVALLSGSRVGFFGFGGAFDTTHTLANGAAIQGFTTENWSGTARGTQVIVGVTPNTTSGVQTSVIFDQDRSAKFIGNIFTGGNVVGSGSLTMTGAVIGSNLVGSNTGDVRLTTVGTTPNANGASIGAGQVLNLQPADSTNPGVVSTASQTFKGVKTFSDQALIADGTVGAPGVAFASETTTGMFKQGSGDIFLSVAGDRSIELKNIATGFVNIGINCSASSSNTVPFQANRTLNGSVFYIWGNLSAGASSGTVFQIANGVGSNYTTVENLANATTAYIGGGSLIGGGVNQLQTVFVNEYTGSNSFQGFCIGGRTLASERMRLNFQGLQLNGGMFLRLIGSSTAGQGLSIYAASSGSAQNLVLPGGVGAAGTAPVNDGANNLSWTATLTNPMTASGDIIVGSGSGVPSKLAVGQSLQVLQVQNTKPAWLATGWNNYRAITGNDTVTASTDCILSISSASSTVTLPSAVGLQGKVFRFIHNGISLTQTYTIATVGSQTITPVTPLGTATSVTLWTQNETFDLLSDNANWIISDHRASSSWTAYAPTFFNLGSTTSVSFKWRRDGSEILIEGNGVTGTVLAGIATCSIPNNLTIDSVSLTVSNNTNTGSTGSVIGRYYQEGSTTNYGALITAPAQNNTVFYFGGAGGQTTKIAPVNASIALQNNTQPFALTGIRIPIAGWQP